MRRRDRGVPGHELVVPPPDVPIGAEANWRWSGGGMEVVRWACGDGRGGAAKGDVEGSDISGDGASAGGSDDGGLGLLEQPFYGLAVRFVAEFAGELEDAGGAKGRHANAAAATVDFGVAIFGGVSLC